MACFENQLKVASQQVEATQLSSAVFSTSSNAEILAERGRWCIFTKTR